MVTAIGVRPVLQVGTIYYIKRTYLFSLLERLLYPIKLVAFQLTQ